MPRQKHHSINPWRYTHAIIPFTTSTWCDNAQHTFYCTRPANVQVNCFLYGTLNVLLLITAVLYAGGTGPDHTQFLRNVDMSLLYFYIYSVSLQVQGEHRCTGRGLPDGQSDAVFKSKYEQPDLASEESWYNYAAFTMGLFGAPNRRFGFVFRPVRSATRQRARFVS